MIVLFLLFGFFIRYFFFFKQKTAYEMRISDWSSDVCSSDLRPVMGMLFRSSGCIALDRDVPVRAASALEEARVAIVRDKLSIWMFPEGTRGDRKSVV